MIVSPSPWPLLPSCQTQRSYLGLLFPPLTSQQHLVMTTLLFLKFYLLLSLGHMHPESRSCFGFDHHHCHHILSTSTRQLCIGQALNKDLLDEACPPVYLLLPHLLLFFRRISLTMDVPHSSGLACLPFSVNTSAHGIDPSTLCVVLLLFCLQGFVESVCGWLLIGSD